VGFFEELDRNLRRLQNDFEVKKETLQARMLGRKEFALSDLMIPGTKARRHHQKYMTPDLKIEGQYCATSIKVLGGIQSNR
jgi:hypothetical protein